MAGGQHGGVLRRRIGQQRLDPDLRLIELRLSEQRGVDAAPRCGVPDRGLSARAATGLLGWHVCNSN